MPIHVLKSLRLLATTLCVLGLFPACSRYSNLMHVEMTARSDANLQNPVSLDLVFVYDDQVAENLAKLNGPEWFRQKETLLLLNNKDMDVIHQELVPGSLLNELALPTYRALARKVFLYANYLGPAGQNVAELSAYACLKIEFLAESYQLKNSSVCTEVRE
jgi:type VI secretion system protein